MLTEARNRPGVQRSVVDVKVRQRRGTELVAGVAAGHLRAPGSSDSTCGVPTEVLRRVRTVWRSPEVRICRGGGSHRRWARSEITALHRSRSSKEAPGSFTASRQSLCGGLWGERCGIVAWLRRRRGLFVVEQSGGVDLGSGRRWRGMCGALRSQGRFKEGGTVIAALGSGKGIPAGSPVISGAR